MKLFERLIYIGIIISLFYLFVAKKSTSIVEIPGDTKIDTVEVSYDSLVYVYNDVYNTDTLWLHDTIHSLSDTVFVYNDFFKMVEYDSILLKNDSSITAWVSAKLTQNRLYEIKGYFLNNRTTTNIIEENYPYGIGGTIGVGITAINGSYLYKQNEFGIGYHFYNENKGFLLHYERKFKLKKLFK